MKPIIKKIYVTFLILSCACIHAVGQDITLGTEPSVPTMIKTIVVESYDVGANEPFEPFTGYGDAIYNLLDETKKGYVRWYIADKEGQNVCGEDNPFTYGVNSNDYIFIPSVGFVFNSATSETQFNQWWLDQSLVTQILNNVSVSMSGFEDGYSVICLIANENPEMTGDVITKEPDFGLKYVFEIKTKSQAEETFEFPDLAGEGISLHKMEMADDNGQFQIDFSSGELSTLITRQFGDSKNNVKYLHFYFVDGNGSPIKVVPTITADNLQGAVSSVNGFFAFNSNGLGYNWGKFTVVKPDGYEWNKIKLMAVLTDDLTGFSEQNDVVLSGPENLKLFVEFTVKTEAFRHYEGIANASGKWDTTSGHQMQYTNEYSYNKFVKAGETIELVLPFDMGDALEPKGYFRWYNYDTDGAIDESSLDRSDYGKELNPLSDEDGNPKGLFAWNLASNPTKENVAAIKFKAPADWADDDVVTIACDVSRYNDGMDNVLTNGSAHLLHEPTLSIRYIFRIRPAKHIADAIKDAIINQGIYENNGQITVCTDATGSGDINNTSTVNLRLQLQEVKDYYFYEYKKSDAYNPNAEAGEEDFVTGTLIDAQDDGIEWRVYNQAGIYYKVIGTGNYKQEGLMCAISPAVINDNGSPWIMTEGYTGNATAPSSFRIGDMAYVVAYLKKGDALCPVARFNCIFQANAAPKEADDPDFPSERTVEYLEANYTKVAELSFDNHDPSSGLAEPTNPLDNMTGKPISWGLRYYGYVYKDLYYKMMDPSNYWYCGLTPIHGEYCLYKSINVENVSKNGAGGYSFQWYLNNDDGEFHDRTWHLTNHQQHGFFLYIDASDESRQIASVAFDGELCAGSSLVVSAAVADLTHNITKPQLMFKLYGVKEEGGEIKERKLVYTIASGDFNKFGTATGKWYQVFSRISIPEGTGVENYKRFYVVIDNYCDGTDGADYAIDDIRIYACNAKAEVIQKTIPCGETKTAEFRIRIPHGTLINWLGSTQNWIRFEGTTSGYKYFYYQIRSKKTGEPVKDVRYKVIEDEKRSNKGDEQTDKYGWGRSRVSRVYNNRPTLDDDLYETVGSETYSVMEETIVLSVPEDGDEYYVALAKPTYGPGNTEGNDENNNKEKEAQLSGPDEESWGHPDDLCSAYSEFFTIKQQGLDITDGSGKIVPALDMPCNPDDGTEYTLKAKLTVPDPVNGGTVTIEDIEYNWSVVKEDEVVYDTEQPTSSLQYKMNKDHISSDGYIYFRLEPATATVEIGGETIALCGDPITARLRINSGGPKLLLGFPDVIYPDNTGTRVLRLGLGQLGDMKDGTLLKILVYGYSTENFTIAVDEAGGKLFVSETTDPLWTQEGEIGTVEKLDEDYITVAINSGDFHEGYEYEVHFQIYDTEEQDVSGGEHCYGDVYFLMKIVPEFATWTGQMNNNNSTNWNNDGNWRRSSKDEIYKGDDYTDYGEGSYSGLAQEQNYVPMKFTKVTIPEYAQAPYLVELASNNSSGIIDVGLTNESGYDATDDIEYDLMVEVEKTDNTYGCEKFYGNTCKEIYFKPQAELRHQENLAYGKAWVEYELEPNKWYTLTSPLKDVYAGDMYVPTGGRQETEAFKDISFEHGNDASGNVQYSRTLYPVYQRSWDTAGSLVIVSKNDEYRDDYDAFIDYGSWDGTYERSMIKNRWSHTYNDVAVPYTPLAEGAQNGFSLRAGKADGVDGGPALIRIPKADTSYDYYNYDDEAEDVNEKVSLAKSSGPNLLVDGSTPSSVTMPLDNDTDGNGLYLVSNPYMASLDMEAFFDKNPGLLGQYWIILRGEAWPIRIGASQVEVPTVDPLQAFFVKKTGDSDISEVTFTAEMMTNKKVDVQGHVLSKVAKHTEARMAMQSVRAATLSASYGGKSSLATLVLDDAADAEFVENEDMETLYDSNLADVPTLYSIAGDRAVCINVLPGVEVLPVGMVCSEDVAATLRLTRNNLGTDLYLFDRATGSSTLLTDSTAVAVRTNEHGRYFLTRSAAGNIGTAAASGLRCYSPVPGMLTVSCLSPDDNIEQVTLFGIDGQKILGRAGLQDASVTVVAPRGVVIAVVKYTGSGKPETFKVMVR